MIKLILNNKEYPNAFENHTGNSVIDTNKKAFFEEKLINSIKEFNVKLKIEKIEYADIKSTFNLAQKRSAVIIKEDAKGQQLLAYVFMSPNTDDSRNILVAQSIFPDLMDTIGRYIDAPFFTMLNLPVYFVNMIDKKIETASIIRDFALLSASGFNYIELFNHSVLLDKKISKSIIKFKSEYYDNLGLVNKYFQLNLSLKKIKILFPVDDLLNADKTDFNGSNEKFYWTQVLFISIIAIKNNFNVDIVEFEQFVNTYESIFSANSGKMERCKVLLKYLKKIIMSSQKSIQKIYYGAPGTGKSFKIDREFIDNDIDDNFIFRTTFHPEFTYSDFIGQLLPTIEENDEGERTISYSFKKGIFTRSLEKAYEDTSKNVYLVLEEMSRGDVAAIFGDIFQLLDRVQNGAKKGYSRYFINNDVIAKDIIAIADDKIKLPPNLIIYGTVNTSDQNVFVMDTAFKRRFDWEYISTKAKTDESGNYLNNPILKIYTHNDVPENFDWKTFYMALNKYISHKDYLELGEDKQIGQFFIEFNNNFENDDDAEIIKSKIQNKLLQYLWNDIQKASFKRNMSLFSEDVSSFSELYDMFEQNKCVFDSEFIKCLKNF